MNLSVYRSAQLTSDVVTLTCNIFMFPFSIETSEVFLERTLEYSFETKFQ